MSLSPAIKPNCWNGADLARALERGTAFSLLDVRNRDEFARHRIEGPAITRSVDFPYFELLEQSTSDDFAESVRDFATGGGFAELPKDGTLLVVCAKGGTSALVSDGMRMAGYDAANLEGGMLA